MDESNSHLTQTDKTLGEFEYAFESSILCIRRALERDKRYIQTGFRRVQHQVSLLAAVRADNGSRIIDTVVHLHVIQRATI